MAFWQSVEQAVGEGSPAVRQMRCIHAHVQPLPRGSVPLDGALLLSFFLYSCVLISACILVGLVPLLL